MRLTIVAALACTGSLCAVGCEGKLENIVPHDMSAHVGDSGGGSTVDLGPPKFSVDIQNSLNSLSCASAPSCHQAPSTTNDPKLIAMATSTADLMANYMAFMAESTPDTAGDNTTAPILTNPTQTGDGSGHSGGMVFTTTSDTYKLWLAWINAGEQF